MYDVDKSHRQRGGDVEERDRQQHQSGRSFRRVLVLAGRSAAGRAVQLPSTRSPRADKTSNDKNVDDEGGQRRDEVEHQLGRPHIDLDGRAPWSFCARSFIAVVNVDVSIE